MAKSYKCKPFDHITKIAENKERKYVSREKIWDANSKLKGKRKNPNILYTKVPGISSRKDPDTLEMPKPGKKVDKKASGKTHVYVVPTTPLYLHMRILKDDFKPIPDNTEYSLEITEPDWTKDSPGWQAPKAPKEKEHPDIQNGVIKVKIPPTAQKGTLTVRLKAEDTDDAKPADADNGAEAADGDKNKANRGEVPVTWDLQIGALNPIGELAPDKNCTSGVQQRLNNLHFNSGPVDGRLGNKTKAAVAAFQSIFNIDVPKGKENNLDQIHTKLEEVHDTDKEVSVPEESGRIKDPSTDVSEKKKLPTSKKDIGHVAPSYGKFKNCNTFMIRPEYRISLELGNINDLFVHKENSLKGKMERMQVAALFYFPMNHKKATEAVNFGWDYYKKKILKENVDKNAFEKLAKHIQNFVVDGGELPPPAEDPKNPKEENFKKMRFPGGYTCTDCKRYWQGAGENPNHDDDYNLGMIRQDVYDAEEMHKHDNIVLGAIPLVALVEKRDEVDDKWKPAEGAMVYFQLAEPYEELPDFDDSVSPSAQINRPDLRTTDMQKNPPGTDKGPNKLVSDLIKVDKPDSDPQRYNCLEKYGGKRGLDVYKNIFEYKVDFRTHKKWADGDPADEKLRPGFHAEHDDSDRKKQVKEPFYPEVKEPDEPDTHKYAVCAKTNKNGYAGVIFKPSTIGGERYRLRAYVGPPTLKDPGSDGTGINAVSVETGTLVVWRNIRISKVRQMPCNNLAKTLQNQIKDHWDPHVKKKSLEVSLENSRKVLKQKRSFIVKLKDSLVLLYHSLKVLKLEHSLKAYKHYGSLQPFFEAMHDKPEEHIKYNTGVININKDQKGYPKMDCLMEEKSGRYYKGLVYQMARSFCELELGPEAKSRELTKDEWDIALDAAIKHAKTKSNNKLPKGHEIDVDKLVIRDKPKVNHSNSFVMIPVCMPRQYNRLVKSIHKLPLDSKKLTLDSSFREDFDHWFTGNLVLPFAYKLADEGFLPGLYILQVPTISTLHATWILGDFAIGWQFRICILIQGKDHYPYPDCQGTGTKKAERYKGKAILGRPKDKDDMGYSALALHEVGHLFFKDHAPPNPISVPGDADYDKADYDHAKERHDDRADGYCVMTYELTEGDYCGKCLLALQGWDMKKLKNLP